jgi:hypothetical protein
MWNLRGSKTATIILDGSTGSTIHLTARWEEAKLETATKIISRL